MNFLNFLKAEFSEFSASQPAGSEFFRKFRNCGEFEFFKKFNFKKFNFAAMNLAFNFLKNSKLNFLKNTKKDKIQNKEKK